MRMLLTLFGLLAPLSATAQAVEEQPVIGWACQEGRVMSGHRRALLQAPELGVQGKQAKPGGNHFVIYQDLPDGVIETVVSWNDQGDALDLSAAKVAPEGPNPFTPQFATSLYAELLAGLKQRLADPARLCIPMRALPPDEDMGDIVVT